MRWGLEWQVFPFEIENMFPEAIKTFACSINRKVQDDAISSFKQGFMSKLIEYLRLKFASTFAAFLAENLTQVGEDSR